MPHSQAYYCPDCTQEGACGYYGVLVFEDSKAPLCRHNEKSSGPGKPCHSDPVRLVPVKKGKSSERSL